MRRIWYNHQNAVHLLWLGRPSMEKGKKINMSEENRTFNNAWPDEFAFITDQSGLPVCLLCGEKLANNKRSNVASHFQNKHTAFAGKYPEGEDRKKAVWELMRQADVSKNQWSGWSLPIQHIQVAVQEIVRHGKPITDEEYIKESFIKISEHLFVDFKDNQRLSCSVLNRLWWVQRHKWHWTNSAVLPICQLRWTTGRTNWANITNRGVSVRLIPLNRGRGTVRLFLIINTTNLVSVATDGAPSRGLERTAALWPCG